MRTLKLLSVLLVCLALSVCAAAADEISGETLQQIIDNSMFINLFDVRTESEYATGAIPGAECIPLDRLEAAMQQILDGGFNNMSVDVYLYGATAEDSAAAAGIMSKLGFTNAHYLAGISAWPGALQDTGLLLGNLDTVDIYGSRVDSTLIADKKLVMVNVWATFCNPCISEMQGLGNLNRELRNQGVMILGVLSDCSNQDLSPNERNVETAKLIAEKTNADYPHLLPSKAMYRDIIAQVQVVPTTYFVDGNGRMVGEVYYGARSESDWLEIIQTTLANMN